MERKEKNMSSRHAPMLEKKILEDCQLYVKANNTCTSQSLLNVSLCFPSIQYLINLLFLLLVVHIYT